MSSPRPWTGWRKRELFDELDLAARRDGLAFACLMATDVARDTSLLLCRGDPKVLTAISYPRKEEEIFGMKGVLSRKKQVIPYLIDVMKRV
jgi:manganese-dependent inorganic pyrophosphatase